MSKLINFMGSVINIKSIHGVLMSKYSLYAQGMIRSHFSSIGIDFLKAEFISNDHSLADS